MSWKFFTKAEFACKCGCGKNNISPDLITKLDEARDMYHQPMTIESGSRCSAWNKHEGGKRTSAHLKGLAADIRCTAPRDRFRLLNIFYILGFKRIGIGRTFIHVDISKELDPEVTWLYED